jgi:ankyrin repeat protein
MPYEALSYTWGGTVKTDKIKINACEFAVTQNLYLALQYLRLENEDRILWIDGLCIDQKNDKEKGHQVQQMGNIYRRAERVVIWLGPATYDTNVLMDSIKQLEKESINYSRNNLRSSDQAWRDIWSNVQPKLRNIHSNVEVRQRNGLESLFKRPWFSRVWILQEVANARGAVVVCGVKSVSARTFAIVPSLIGVAPPPHCQSILDIMPGPLREESWWSQNQDLRTLLLKFGKTAASDPRDNIYALIGLSSDACDSDLLRADYSKSVQEVIKDVALFLLRCPALYDTPFLSKYTMPQFLEIAGFLSNLALSWADKTKNESLTKALLAHDSIDVNSKDDKGATPLLLAVKTESNWLAKLLIEHEDIYVNLKDEDGRTPLMVAVQGKITGEMIELLPPHRNIDFNLKDKNERTPLMEAAQVGLIEIIELLLSHSNIDVNLKDKNERTPLMEAVQAGRKGIAKMLLSHSNIDVNLQDKSGDTALHVATRFPAIASLVLAHDDIKLNLKNTLGQTALQKAEMEGNLQVVELMNGINKEKIRQDQDFVP